MQRRIFLNFQTSCSKQEYHAKHYRFIWNTFLLLSPLFFDLRTLFWLWRSSTTYCYLFFYPITVLLCGCACTVPEFCLTLYWVFVATRKTLFRFRLRLKGSTSRLFSLQFRLSQFSNFWVVILASLSTVKVKLLNYTKLTSVVKPMQAISSHFYREVKKLHPKYLLFFLFGPDLYNIKCRVPRKPLYQFYSSIFLSTYFWFFPMQNHVNRGPTLGLLISLLVQVFGKRPYNRVLYECNWGMLVLKARLSEFLSRSTRFEDPPHFCKRNLYIRQRIFSSTTPSMSLVPKTLGTSSYGVSLYFFSTEKTKATLIFIFLLTLLSAFR